MARVLVVGGGGREHALVDVLARSPSRPELFVAPGNAGTAGLAKTLPIAVHAVSELVEAARANRVDLVVVGPEVPLVLGLVDRLAELGIPAFGPRAAAARLEGSKAFSKALMEAAGVPTARFVSTTRAEEAIEFARALGGRVAVKADGLAAGKGVIVTGDEAEAAEAIRQLLADPAAQGGLVVEERLEGEELSVLALTDGTNIAWFSGAQDHKRVFDLDEGPNTGGMGAYAPAPKGTPALLREAERIALRPVLDELAERGTPFQGVLYAGLMLTAQGPRVLEYNVRFGDPEAQVLLPRLRGDVFELLLAAATGRLAPGPLPEIDEAALTVVLAAAGYPGAPRKGDVITGLSEAARIPGLRVYHAGTERSGEQVVTSGGRVLAVTGFGADLAAAREVAYRGVSAIHFEGMHFRRDIGARALGGPIG